MVPKIVWRTSKSDENDFIDSQNYKCSTILIIILICMIGAVQYLNKPIQCWCPQEFSNNWVEYAESYCYLSSTHFKPFNNSLQHGITRDKRSISYYQWTLVLLFTQALFFFIPSILWRFLILKSVFNLQRILQIAKDANSAAPAHYHKSIGLIAVHMNEILKRNIIYDTGIKPKLQRFISFSNVRSCARISGNYLSFVYITIKILYLLNIFGQLFLMQKFIGSSYSLYGIHMLYNLIIGAEMQSSAHLPREIFCGFKIMKLGKSHFYTIQCVLPINMFLEKIFIFLWFWHIVIGCMTAFDLISWFNKFINKKYQFRYIHEYLKLKESIKASEEPLIKQFIYDYLRRDGIFIINLISINNSDIVAADIVNELLNLNRNQKQNEDDQLKSYGETNFS